jgi:hypothetical protein
MMIPRMQMARLRVSAVMAAGLAHSRRLVKLFAGL